jgi:hypothetical protein
MADVKQILNERGKVHGDFTDHATFAQHLKRIAQSSKNWTALNTVQTEGLEMILHKVARILAGDPNHADHWNDIAGYATLVSDRLDKRDAGLPTADDVRGILKAEEMGLGVPGVKHVQSGRPVVPTRA